MLIFRTLAVLIGLFPATVLAGWVDGSHLPFAKPSQGAQAQARAQVRAQIRQQLISRQQQAETHFASIDDALPMTLSKRDFQRLNPVELEADSLPLQWNGQAFERSQALDFSFDEVIGLAEADTYQQLRRTAEDWAGRFQQYGLEGKMAPKAAEWGSNIAKSVALDLVKAGSDNPVYVVSVIRDGQRIPLAMATASVSKSFGDYNLYLANVVANPESLLLRDARLQGETFGGAGNSVINRLIERFFTQTVKHNSGEIMSIPLTERMKAIFDRYAFTDFGC